MEETVLFAPKKTDPLHKRIGGSPSFLDYSSTLKIDATCYKALYHRR
jgi:hypothetical protein